MPLNFRKKLFASAIALFLAFSTAQAQVISGYIGSTSADDGYKGDIRKVTITKNPAQDSQNRIELTYDTKGRCIARTSAGQSAKYTYGNGYVIETTGSYVSSKATFNDDNTLKEYTTYNSKGKIIRHDTYTYKNGKPIGMERTDGQGNLVSKWTYTTDADGNTLVKNDTATSSYTYNTEGTLIKEYRQLQENAFFEVLYDDAGDEISYKGYSFPSQAIRMLGETPSTDTTYTINRTKDSAGRLKEVETIMLDKLNEQWFDADGNFVSSENRTNTVVELKWNSYRYDGKLAEVQTELWSAQTDENPTGYSSLAEEYFYNNNGLLTQIVIYDESGSEAKKHVYRYNEEGILDCVETSYADLEQTEKEYYSWNEKNQMISKLSHVDFNEEDEQLFPFQTSLEEYEYTEDEKLSKLYYTAISRLPSAEDGTVLQSSSSMEALFFYNKNGLLAKEQKKYKDRTETLLYYYDESGRKTKTSWLTEYPDGKKHYLEHAYIYEADGDYTKMTEYYSLRTKKVYTYNAKGNVSTIKLYEIYNIGGSDTAILTSVTEYAYN